MFDFKFVRTEQDHYDFIFYNIFIAPEGKKNFYRLKRAIPLMLASVLLILAAAMKFNLELLLFPAAIFIIISVLWLLSIKRVVLHSIRRYIKRMKIFEPNAFKTPVTIKFDEDKIEVLSDTTENKIKYDLVQRIVNTKNAVYIVLDSKQAFILPARELKSNDERDRFLSFLANKTKKIIKEATEF